MLTHNLGYPRIGSQRILKHACERYWAGEIGLEALVETGRRIRRDHWLLQREAGIDLIPCNDFSFYDQILDMSLTVGAIPERYQALAADPRFSALDLGFAMARGYQQEGLDLIALELTKWFDTNYHYLVPEFHKNQPFRLCSRKLIEEFCEARGLGLRAKPVLIGPVSYLWLGKEKEAGFHRLALLEQLLPVYAEVLGKLEGIGSEYVQIDEPLLAMDLSDAAKAAFARAYAEIQQAAPRLKIILATYFEGLRENTELTVNLPVHALHVDLVRAPTQLDAVLEAAPRGLTLSLGVVDGRNIWKNDLERSLALIHQATDKVGSECVMLAPSCSLLHVPCDLTTEPEPGPLPVEVRHWLAFARQKLDEVVTLARLATPETEAQSAERLAQNRADIESRRQSSRIHRPGVQVRVAAIHETDTQRQSPFTERREKQRAALHLPLFPTTTIGSFPQTEEMRTWRAKRKRGEVSEAQYEAAIRAEIERAIRWQESIGLDVLVHGEFERNDMVEYFGERLAGFAFTANGWVQSYGSRCVKPPILYGDVERQGPMTVAWTHYAQSLTDKVVKGMLTGPVTILQWSLVRDDQPRAATALQLALAIRDEVQDLEAAGIRIIQIDEPALREGLPLRRADWEAYLAWAVKAFRVATAGVRDQTQIHTHMCYSEFNDIIAHLAALDADVITIETSRSQMELLDAFVGLHYPNEIGPGVYDIHSPRVPREEEITALLHKALTVVPAERLWVNPDCGLKTRQWPETRAAIATLVAAARRMRAKVETEARL
jgi:5-methyltetrahydropteroyltriglutamate--homocysteine methyltransferase